MTLRRKARALSVQAKFHRVDLMVLTEGGSSEVAEVDSLYLHKREIVNDTIFWRIVFEKFGFPNSVHYKAMGSKAHLKTYANEIISENINNLCVAMDTDLDDLNGEKIDAVGILYTYGYSWENDVYSKASLKSYLMDMLIEYADHSSALTEIDRLVDNFIMVARDIMVEEYKFRKLGIKFITNLSSERFTRIDSTGVYLNLEEISKERKIIKEQISQKKWESIDEPSASRIERFIYGKLVEHFYFLLTQYLEKKFLTVKGKRHKEYFRRQFLGKFKSSTDQESYDYYRAKIDLLSKNLN